MPTIDFLNAITTPNDFKRNCVLVIAIVRPLLKVSVAEAFTRTSSAEEIDKPVAS